MTIFYIIFGIFLGTLVVISIVIGIAENRGIKGVCIRCGFLKRNLLKACTRCKFVPSSNEDLAKSFMLSTKEHNVGNIFPGKPLSELKRIGNRIEGGKEYRFDAIKLQEIMKNF